MCFPGISISNTDRAGHAQVIGTATGIPGSVLGLTLLAWGNSAGDLVTNLAVAKAGFPGMAIAGSYGGPLFNILLGIGLPMFYSSARYGAQPYRSSRFGLISRFSPSARRPPHLLVMVFHYDSLFFALSLAPTDVAS